MGPSKKTSLATAVLLLALAGVAGAIAQARASGNVDQAVTARTISLRSCLLGGPLAPNETPLQRLRRVEMGQPPTDSPDEQGGNWPLRCERDAAGLLLGDDEHGGHGVGSLDAVPVANGAVLVMSALGSRTRGTFLVSVDREGRFGRIAFD